MRLFFSVCFLACALTLGNGSSVQASEASSSSASQVQCLAQAIFYEARGESKRGKVLVGLVVRNRTQHAAWPKSICGVVWQKGQFSWTADSHRSAFRPTEEIETLARQIYAGEYSFPPGWGCVQYFATRPQPWMDVVGRVGGHVFGCPG